MALIALGVTKRELGLFREHCRPLCVFSKGLDTTGGTHGPWPKALQKCLEAPSTFPVPLGKA